MNKILIAVLALVAAFAVAQDASTPPPPAKPEAAQASRFRGNPEAGLVSRKIGEGGFLRFLDCRREKTDLKPIVAKMPQSFEIAIDTASAERGEGCPMKVAMNALKDKDVAVAIVLSNEGKDAPSLIVCPEDKAAVINVDRLISDDAGLYTKRLTKEMWRAVAFVMGGYEVDYPCVMKTVASVEDLDANQLEMTCPPVSGHVARNAAKFGVAKMQCVPYFIALRQGWAPAPVNDAQKEEVARFEKMKAAKTEAAAKPAVTSETK